MPTATQARLLRQYLLTRELADKLLQRCQPAQDASSFLKAGNNLERGCVPRSEGKTMTASIFARSGITAATFAVGLWAQEPPQPPQQTRPSPALAPGAALSGIGAEARALFEAGKEDFLENEDPADGLGPAFNGISCGGCHNLPAVGGTGNVTEVRAGRTVNGRFVEPEGGSLIHLFATDPRCQPAIPADAAVVAGRIPTPLFGAGLVEAIPDETLVGLQAASRGRVSRVRDLATGATRVGRFGWKAQHATLISFAADAYVNEMGITNDLLQSEVGSGITPTQLAACDPTPAVEDVRDPVTRRRGIDNFANFMRFLAPVEQAAMDGQARRGEMLFGSIGCATCHVPVLQTGRHENSALNRKNVPAYSDFLLHDVGTGDGIEQASASGNEFRTAPLWGLRFRKRLLHDGGAITPEQAIVAHGSEAAQARDRFRRLDQGERQALLAFLRTL